MIFKTFQKDSVQFEKKPWQNEPIKHLNFHAPHSEYTFEFSLVQHEERSLGSQTIISLAKNN